MDRYSGENSTAWHGRIIRAGGVLQLGHGLDGLHPFLGAVVLACERADGRCLAMGVYPGHSIRCENGDLEYGGVLGGGSRVVLDVSAGQQPAMDEEFREERAPLLSPVSSQET